MTKLDIATEFLKAHPEALNLNNTQVAAAIREAGRGEISNETVRQARKIVEADAPADEQPEDGPEQPDVNEDEAEGDESLEDEPEPEGGETDESVPEITGDVTGLTSDEPAPATASPNTGPEPVVITREPVEGRCNHRMERAKDLCGRPLNHSGGHVTVAQMAKKKAFSKARAKVRYHNDPEYAERIKKASRDSHKKARVAAKAAKEAAEAAAKAEAGEPEVEAPQPGAEVEQHDAA